MNKTKVVIFEGRKPKKEGEIPSIEGETVVKAVYRALSSLFNISSGTEVTAISLNGNTAEKDTILPSGDNEIAAKLYTGRKVK